MPRSKLCWVFIVACAIFPVRALLRATNVKPTPSQLKAFGQHTNMQSENRNQLKEAVVVTLHKLTPGVRELLSELHGSIWWAGGGRDLWALVDGKTATSTMVEEVGEYIGNSERVVKVEYQSMLHKIFPHASAKQKKAFNTFEGIHHSPAKPGAVWFLAEGPGTKYEFVWVLESDVRFVQASWVQFFDQYSQHQSDLVSVIDQPKKWANWKGCTHDGCFGADRKRTFLPMFRISRRLARDVLESLRHGHTGHHEAFFHAVCRKEQRWKCVMEDLKQSAFYGKMTFSEPLPKMLLPGKIYHPIKSA